MIMILNVGAHKTSFFPSSKNRLRVDTENDVSKFLPNLFALLHMVSHDDLKAPRELS